MLKSHKYRVANGLIVKKCPTNAQHRQVIHYNQENKYRQEHYIEPSVMPYSLAQWFLIHRDGSGLCWLIAHTALHPFNRFSLICYLISSAIIVSTTFNQTTAVPLILPAGQLCPYELNVQSKEGILFCFYYILLYITDSVQLQPQHSSGLRCLCNTASRSQHHYPG